MSGLVNFDVGSLADSVMDGLDGLFTSDAERAAAALKIKALMAQPHMMQAQANIEAAKNTNWFVAGGRPSLMWVCAIALFYNWLIKDLIVIGIVSFNTNAAEIVPLLPTIDGAEVTGLVTTLLGLGALRTFEKLKDKAR
jgi:hypothetical protein|tara:strand:+ start:1902 stop:2318 length:417 start_codon:yes stop_codon:yes gene_type:complete